MNLEPLAPKEAVKQYLESREHDASDCTIRNHRYRLDQFLQWAQEQDPPFDNMNDLTGRKAEQFKNWWISERDINSVTMENHLRTFRVFVRWCESVDAVEEGVSGNILIPRISDNEKTQEEFVSHDTAEMIIDYLCCFEYTTQSHIIFTPSSEVRSNHIASEQRRAEGNRFRANVCQCGYLRTALRRKDEGTKDRTGNSITTSSDISTVFGHH